MNDISYNLRKHIELLKYENKLLKENRSFFKENEAEWWELTKYGAAVDKHIFWEDRFQVALLMQAFINKEMDAQEFHDSIFGLRRKHLAKCNEFLSKLASEEIKNFFPNEKSYKLKGFLTFLYCQCEDFEMNYDEEEFYISILDTFLQFQKILNEE